MLIGGLVGSCCGTFDGSLGPLGSFVGLLDGPLRPFDGPLFLLGPYIHFLKSGTPVFPPV